MYSRYDLDTLDRQILNILQSDATVSIATLAEHLHTSITTCQRRILRLQESRILLRRVAIVDPLTVGCQLSIFVSVALEQKSQDKQEAFVRAIEKEADIVQLHEISGQYDYLMLLHVRDMATFHRMTQRLFSTENNVRAFESQFILKTHKNDTKITL